MTPERAEELKRQQYTTMTFDEATELCDSALRLAAIEGAGDEDIRQIVNDHDAAECWEDEDKAFKQMTDIAKSRNATIADLRAKLGEAQALLKWVWETQPFLKCNREDPRYMQIHNVVSNIKPESEVQGG